MPKVLSMVPTEGESTEEFAARAAASIQEFFGADAPAEEPPAEPEAEPEAAPTDETAEPEAPAEETPPEG